MYQNKNKTNSLGQEGVERLYRAKNNLSMGKDGDERL
jgi:hypothetical protein